MQDLLVPLQMGPPGPPGMKKGAPKGRPSPKPLDQQNGVPIRPSNRSWSFGSTLDYYAIPETYIQTLEKGPTNDVPIITGNNKDERFLYLRWG